MAVTTLKHTVCRDILALILFLPFIPSLQVGKFKVE